MQNSIFANSYKNFDLSVLSDTANFNGQAATFIFERRSRNGIHYCIIAKIK
jgi:hypothetical protein